MARIQGGCAPRTPSGSAFRARHRTFPQVVRFRSARCVWLAAISALKLRSTKNASGKDAGSQRASGSQLGCRQPPRARVAAGMPATVPRSGRHQAGNASGRDVGSRPVPRSQLGCRRMAARQAGMPAASSLLFAMEPCSLPHATGSAHAHAHAARSGTGVRLRCMQGSRLAPERSRSPLASEPLRFAACATRRYTRTM